uniref:Chromosome 20 open reading frame 204 n=1 Tax=Sciurus vulgaris TaxID=55149 RepID=A0A8D2CXC0_SCIVU
MVPSKPTLCALLLALLWFVPGWARLSACSVPEVLRHYRAVIFQDLQAAVRRGAGPGSGYRQLLKKNLTGTGGGRAWPRVSCGAQKEHGILLFIESLGQTLRGAVTGGRRGNLEKAAWTVALRTEAVMRRHCWKPRQQSRRPRTRPAPRRGGRRRLLLRVLDTVATCWEKLFALRATATGES